jgi:hypothetical protein
MQLRFWEPKFALWRKKKCLRTCALQRNDQLCIYMYVYTYIYIAISNGKSKPRRFSLIRLPFAYLTTEICRLSVCWRKNKRSYPLANGLNGLNGLAHLCVAPEYMYCTEHISPTVLHHQSTHKNINKKIIKYILSPALGSFFTFQCPSFPLPISPTPVGRWGGLATICSNLVLKTGEWFRYTGNRSHHYLPPIRTG